MKSMTVSKLKRRIGLALLPTVLAGCLLTGVSTADAWSPTGKEEDKIQEGQLKFTFDEVTKFH